MLPNVPDHLIVALLRQYYTTPGCLRSSNLRALSSIAHQRSLHISTASQSLLSQAPADHPNKKTLQRYNGSHPRAYATAAESAKASNEIAVLGGGITGLATAYFLTKELPDAKVTIYEASDSLGGWLRTKRVQVGNGFILFEQGPRTLRPSTPPGLLTLQLARTLGLEDEMIATSRNSIAAKNRYIYYPDRLVTMPGPGRGLFNNLWLFLKEPVFNSALPALIGEYRIPKRSDDLQDESVGSFLQRRIATPSVVDNVFSAGLHGIYAGDVYQLSAKSLMRGLWDWESIHGGILAGVFASLKPGSRPQMWNRDVELLTDIRNAHVEKLKTELKSFDISKVERMGEIYKAVHYSFKRGLGTLSEALVSHLKHNNQVEIKTGHTIDLLEYHKENNSILIKSNQTETSIKAFSRVISTIPGRKLSFLTPAKPSSLLPSLASIHSVTVMVVNLYFTNPNILPVHGFGYLIPRSIPFEQNPECALGVVFDSESVIGQDTVPGTKLTVMIGGHWWDGNTTYPNEAEGLEMAKSVLKRHLGINEEPAKFLVGLHKEAIPQYTVGHHDRMKSAHDELLSGFGGRLTVAGSSYTGVGVNDCVRAAKDVADRIKDCIGMGDGLGVTGLETFLGERKYVSMPMAPTVAVSVARERD